MSDMNLSDEIGPPEAEGVKVYFNPFQFTIEQNNAFLAAGYEVMPLRIPDSKEPS